ncbi:hypothetical protein AZI85_07890 [Bdellovibrio bacteriovorus]|uniref:Uncharacterized protein n=1 Tax=Bdellovibrio bacteriovorus TaxID=959 RepID=A0A150WGK0_BDEBC|nr:hypothetical protein [Bdellovibrio bacteriovorus]KYG62110.1 hypothetical protein AZI85_07890 [Bdellovibrio bacteriovorus]
MLPKRHPVHIFVWIAVVIAVALFLRASIQHSAHVFTNIFIFLLNLFIWLAVLNLNYLTQKFAFKKLVWILLFMQALTIFSAYHMTQQVLLFGLIASLSLNLLAYFVYMANEKKVATVVVLASLAFLVSLLTTPLEFWLTAG